MTDQAQLERRYRRLLAWYPRTFRRENEEEILAVLMAGASDGQRRPGLAEAADLMRSGLSMRLRLPPSTRSARAAVRVMYTGAALTTLVVIAAIVSLFSYDHPVEVIGAPAQAAAEPFFSFFHFVPHPGASSDWIMMGIVSGLVVIALWVWLAQAVGQGRSWARIVFTVLFGLATWELIYPCTRISPLRGLLFGLFFWAPTWLISAVVTWLLWRPSSGAVVNRREVPLARQDS